MTEPTPAQRACERIQALAQSQEHYCESEDAPCMVRDMLTDIRHFCEQQDVDFYRATHASYQVYLEEKLWLL